MNRFASMLKRGIKLCFGSDWYITELDAIAGIHAAVNHHNEDERIGAAQAIEAYTLSAAWLAHEERSKGSLEPGKWADFSLSSHDLLQPFEPEETRILGVYRRGAKQA